MDGQQTPPLQVSSEVSVVAPRTTVSGVYENLTTRELEVALAVSEGRSNRDIASRLSMSQKTVEYHLGNIFGKLGVKSRTQLALTLLGAPSHPVPRLDDLPV